jgi:rhodanese-related sulfurtransferase
VIARLMGLATISPRELQGLMENDAVTIIDVNSPQSWRHARVPGAINLDPLRYGGGDLPPDKSAALIFYCSSFLCRRAPNAARRAKSMGYHNVRVMSAGISGWLDNGMPTESGDELRH